MGRAVKESMTEGERQGITISVEEVEEIRQKSSNCLVGKYWMEKRYNKEAFKSVLSKLWRSEGGVNFKELQDNLWLFEFAEEEDKRRVLDGRPWSFDRQLVVIQEFDGLTPPSQMQLNQSVFWIQIHDMPLLCMTKSVGTKIGESLGKLEGIDVAKDGAGWGKCLRIRVRIDVTKPLERGRELLVGGRSIWVFFKYEKLSQFYYNCGRIVHGPKGCSSKQGLKLTAEEDEKAWGPWLRTDDLGGKNGSKLSSEEKLLSPEKGWTSGGAAQPPHFSGMATGDNHGNPKDASVPNKESSSADSSSYHNGYGAKSTFMANDSNFTA